MNNLDANISLTSGNYSISTNKEIGVISLNYNEAESRMKPLEEQQILDIFKSAENEVEISKIEANSSFVSSDLHKPLSYWKICIVITLIFVAIEMLLIRFFK